MSNRALLRIYLNDHLAAALGARELTRRSLRSNEGNEYGRFLGSFLRELEEDRVTLEQLLTRLGLPQARAKQALAWAAEKAGRLKLNGRLTSYSPLSRLVELEMLTLGVSGKLLLWRTLERLAAGDPSLTGFDFTALAARAESQRAGLEEHRLRAAQEALSS
jgi:hypothetical protein